MELFGVLGIYNFDFSNSRNPPSFSFVHLFVFTLVLEKLLKLSTWSALAFHAWSSSEYLVWECPVESYCVYILGQYNLKNQAYPLPKVGTYTSPEAQKFKHMRFDYLESR